MCRMAGIIVFESGVGFGRVDIAVEMEPPSSPVRRDKLAQLCLDILPVFRWPGVSCPTQQFVGVADMALLEQRQPKPALRPTCSWSWTRAWSDTCPWWPRSNWLATYAPVGPRCSGCRFGFLWTGTTLPIFRATVRFWAYRFLDTLTITELAAFGGRRPRFALPIGGQARRAQYEWVWFGMIWREIKDCLPDGFQQRDWFWEISRRWELRWAQLLADARGFVSAEEMADVARCDRTWWALVREHLVPRGYRPLPDTMARLL